MAPPCLPPVARGTPRERAGLAILPLTVAPCPCSRDYRGGKTRPRSPVPRVSAGQGRTGCRQVIVPARHAVVLRLPLTASTGVPLTAPGRDQIASPEYCE